MVSDNIKNRCITFAAFLEVEAKCTNLGKVL